MAVNEAEINGCPALDRSDEILRAGGSLRARGCRAAVSLIIDEDLPAPAGAAELEAKRGR